MSSSSLGYDTDDRQVAQFWGARETDGAPFLPQLADVGGVVAENCESTAYDRARYYNSLTGRFLSRDTESGKPKDPKSLHKYLYANGDPVNRLDPKGRDSIIDYAIELGESEQSIAELRATAAAVRNALMEVCVTEQLGIMLESGLYVGLSWEALVAEATAYCEYLLF